MRSRTLHKPWRVDWALLISALTACKILYLGATNKLAVYIHPRFTLFSVVMAALFLLACFSSNTTNHQARHQRYTVSHKLSSIGLIIVALALLIVKPTSLSSSTVTTRTINASTGSINSDALGTLQRFGGDMSQLSIKEWSSIITQLSSSSYIEGKSFDGVGFVTLDPSGNPDIFYVSRFVLTCCAVDARPIGVPVYYPGWQDSYRVDQWVHATGTFQDLPNKQLAVIPENITITQEPEQPYEY